jgi:hypothetical protein
VQRHPPCHFPAAAGHRLRLIPVIAGDTLTTRDLNVTLKPEDDNRIGGVVVEATLSEVLAACGGGGGSADPFEQRGRAGAVQGTHVVADGEIRDPGSTKACTKAPARPVKAGSSSSPAAASRCASLAQRIAALPKATARIGHVVDTNKLHPSRARAAPIAREGSPRRGSA